MQLLIVNRNHGGYERGDILAVLPDIHVWSALEVASTWLASDAVAIAAGLPEEYRAPFIRNTANFPNPQFAIARYPSYRCDLNLAEPLMAVDPNDPEATINIGRRLWYIDLDSLPPGQRNSLEQPGGEGTLGANRLNAIKSRFDATDITTSNAWTSDTTLGNSPHRHPFTDARTRSGIV